MRKYNTIIVGAGPAGLIAGSILSDAIILEKKSEIGIPVQCGEKKSKNALQTQNIKNEKSFICSEIHSAKRFVPNGKHFGSWHTDPSGYVIDRSKFEKLLAKNIKSELRLNVNIKKILFKSGYWNVVLENEDVLISKNIIGADGVNSIVRKCVFKEQPEIISTIQWEIRFEKEIDEKTIKIFLDNKKYNHGYGWIFPKGKKIANVGVCGKGFLLDSFNLLVKEIKRDYGKCEFIKNKTGAIPLRKKTTKFYHNNAALVGDAAGLADPIFKGGMNQAMQSANIAAQCILENRFEDYEKEIKKMPFAKNKLIDQANIFYSFDNNILNEVGKMLEKENIFLFFINIFRNKHSRKKFFKIINFFYFWKKNKKYLW